MHKTEGVIQRHNSDCKFVYKKKQNCGKITKSEVSGHPEVTGRAGVTAMFGKKLGLKKKIKNIIMMIMAAVMSGLVNAMPVMAAAEDAAPQGEEQTIMLLLIMGGVLIVILAVVLSVVSTVVSSIASVVDDDDSAE